MTTGKRDTFPNQLIEMRCLHKVKPQPANRVIALLVSDNEDDIGPRRGHCLILQDASLRRFVDAPRRRLAGFR